MQLYRKSINRLWLLGAVLFVASSCNDWLEVRPKSEIPTDIHFERESGYADQLAGVYTALYGIPLYGCDMSFGLMEVLSQNYDLNTNSVYRYAAMYNYNETGTKARIDRLWTMAYNCIANLNILLEYVNKADPAIFSDNHYEQYKGEALGLRAFLHLDLLRIFSPSPVSNPNALGIPYVTEYSTAVTGQKTVNETLDLIINDLNAAVDILKADSIRNSNTYYADRRERLKYFNYYAAVAALARAYMYKGDKINALKYSEEIIAEGETFNSVFPWTHYSALETTYEYECNRIFSTEHIFSLAYSGMDNVVKYYFTSLAGDNDLSPSENKADVIFERTAKGYGNDYRMLKGFAYDGEKKYFWKYHQYENGPYNERLPIIRKSESYYIAAEILKDSEPARAVELLNIVRSYRNLSAFSLPDNLTPDEIRQEIYKEYRKEFLGEGQLFFYYKRLNSARIEGAAVNANDAIYVLPIPDNEIEFGGRK
ncbi:MAG: RagB/SusD family nutrient uptake outer membrane protein [Prevotellaceae bacterium]|nr:RagB/SusD family nutrient uptake outer membrane protein [Prevotellaceae bacterium]